MRRRFTNTLITMLSLMFTAAATADDSKSTTFKIGNEVYSFSFEELAADTEIGTISIDKVTKLLLAVRASEYKAIEKNTTMPKNERDLKLSKISASMEDIINANEILSQHTDVLFGFLLQPYGKEFPLSFSKSLIRYGVAGVQGSGGIACVIKKNSSTSVVEMSMNSLSCGPAGLIAAHQTPDLKSVSAYKRESATAQNKIRTTKGFGMLAPLNGIIPERLGDLQRWYGGFAYEISNEKASMTETPSTTQYGFYFSWQELSVAPSSVFIYISHGKGQIIGDMALQVPEMIYPILPWAMDGTTPRSPVMSNFSTSPHSPEGQLKGKSAKIKSYNQVVESIFSSLSELHEEIEISDETIEQAKDLEQNKE